MGKAVGNFFKSLFVAILGGVFSSIALIGFNFSNLPLETFLKVFWPTAVYCSFFCFTGTWASIRFMNRKTMYEKSNVTQKILILVVLGFFVMTAKGTYEYIVSPLRLNAKIKGIRPGRINKTNPCVDGHCGVRYNNQVPNHSKHY